MPSPAGHALGGFIAGWLVAGPGAGGPNRWPRRALAFVVLGLAADLDLLVGRHSQFTHSVGAALVVFSVAAIVASRRESRWLLLALAATAAYASHPLLDWLGQDSTPPRGITALWPFSRDYFLSHADLFWGISRQPWRPGMLTHNALAIAREVVMLAPLAFVVWWLRRPHRFAQFLPPSTAGGDQALQNGGDRAREAKVGDRNKSL